MKQPCRECPFRKVSAPGYLGEASYDPVLFLSTIEHQPLPCHLSIDWNEESDIIMGKESIHCVGALQFLRNTAKLPRNRLYAALRDTVTTSEKIFATMQDFINHHSKKRKL